MAVDQRIAGALRPFERRAIVVLFLETTAATLTAAALVSEAAWAAGLYRPSVAVALVALALAAAALFANSRRPTAIVLARRIDRRADLQDLIVTALGSDGEGMASIVRMNALSALGRVRPRDMYPREALSKWPFGLIAAAAIAAVVMAVAAPAPAERAQAAGTSALTIPVAGGAASPGPEQKQTAPPPPTSTPAARAAVENSSRSAASGAAGRLVPAELHGAGAQASAGGDDRLRLAAANADTDIAAGRVPVSRRAIVEHYFAALQLARKQPR